MKWFLVLLPFVLSCACQSSPDSDAPWRSLARSSISGVAEAGAHVARDDAQWRALWSRHTQAVVRPAEAPVLDLEREMAILVSDGQKPSAGWSLEVTAVNIERGELVVHARVVAPPADMLQAQVVTAPCELIATTRHKLPVRVNIAR